MNTKLNKNNGNIFVFISICVVVIMAAIMSQVKKQDQEKSKTENQRQESSLDASGKSTGNTEGATEEEVLEKYYSETILAEMGKMKSPQNGTVNVDFQLVDFDLVQGMDKDSAWLERKGVIGSTIQDLDGDEKPELILLAWPEEVEEYSFPELSIYGVEDSQVQKKDHLLLASVGEGWNAQCFMEGVFFGGVVARDNQKHIVLLEERHSAAFADGGQAYVSIYGYAGGKLQIIGEQPFESGEFDKGGQKYLDQQEKGYVEPLKTIFDPKSKLEKYQVFAKLNCTCKEKKEGKVKGSATMELVCEEFEKK